MEFRRGAARPRLHRESQRNTRSLRSRSSNESYSTGGIRILYRAFHTTKESRRQKQPHISSSGAVITWDGRLDNRADLISELRDSLTVNSTDVAIPLRRPMKSGARVAWGS